ncbi:Phage-related tail fibre protein, partial [Pseudomonas sp. LAMO17WK12:I10]|uniref:phage tail protein n=1 Tax=unclassified Pseudomonas TaxID=196821 RepID=UPI000BC85B8E
MTDQNSQFFAILTAVGKAKQANADALGIPWTFAQMGVGDANGTDPIPSEQQAKLIHENRRAPLNQVKVDPNNANVIIAEQVIP